METIGSVKEAGAPVVPFGNPAGAITTGGALWIDQETAGAPGTAGGGDRCGWAVGAPDTDGEALGMALPAPLSRVSRPRRRRLRPSTSR